MNRILITGADGFVGKHLHAALRREHEIGAPAFDLASSEDIERVVGAKPWDAVVHLAGLSQIAECEKDPARAKRINVEGSRALFARALKRNPKVHFIFASTSQVYGPGDGEDVVLNEESAVRPSNVYAQTKWLVENFLRLEAKPSAFTILRFFNHTHKSQSPNFFMPHIYQQLLRLRTTSEDGDAGGSIPVGNLKLKRDIGSVRDLVAAIEDILRLEQGTGETLNVCSGQTKELGNLAEGLRARLEVEAEFVVDPQRLRAGEPKAVRGSHTKLTALTGWVPRVGSGDELVRDFLSDYP